MKASASEKEDPESSDLARFREEWKAEVRRRRAAAAGDSDTANAEGQSAVASSDSSVATSRSFVFPNLTARETLKQNTLPNNHPAISGVTQLAINPKLDAAVDTYRQAIVREQRGEYDDALVLYRQAFRLDTNVDRAYQREEMIASVLQAQVLDPGNMANSPDSSDGVGEVKTTPSAVKSSGTEIAVSARLATVLDSFPELLKFDPDIEGEPSVLNILPDELVTMILRKLDPTSIERFACISRKARVLTLESVIWKELVGDTYKPPQVPDMKAMLTLMEQYIPDFRSLYIQHPRVRLDGVYIAICHYIRPGLSENSWVNISHLITYHRYLRFFPDGQVLSLLASGDEDPKRIIPLLKPSLRMKGLFIGKWCLSGTTVFLSQLFDASGRYALPEFQNSDLPLSVNPISEESTALRYVFLMSLELRSRPLGRWNRMDIQSYNSVNLSTGDAIPVALKHERPFWFSKVRSYVAG